MRFHDGANVLSQLRVLLFQARSAPRCKVLQATHTLPKFMKSLVDRAAAPAKPAFRFACIAIAQLERHFRHEQTPLVSFQTPGSLLKQQLVTIHRVFHDSILEWCRETTTGLPASHIPPSWKRSIYG